MDASSLRDSWTWMDGEDLRLDAAPPLAMPDCMWDDLVDNEAVVRSLFPSSPRLNDSDPLGLSFEQQDYSDCNPAPLKRRRILELNENNPMDISSCLPETSHDFLIEVCEELQLVDPSSSGSVWYLANEEPLSSVDDAVEHSSESWRMGCISDSDTSDVQEPAHCPINPPINGRTSHPMAGNKSGLMHTMSCSTVPNAMRQRHQQLAPSKLVCPPAGNVQTKKSRWDIVEKFPRIKEPVSIQPRKDCSSSKECPIPVLAYPFALVKPIGIQGDITLQDINQRINASPNRGRTCFEQPKSTSSSPYSGKSVLALTKIYTEGNGTITIMRTKG